MLIFLILSCFILYSSAAEAAAAPPPQDYRKFLDSDILCKSECNATSEMLKTIDISNFTTNLSSPVQCYLYCFLNQFGALKGGEVQLKEFVELIYSTDCAADKTQITERIQSCSDIEGSTPTDTSVNIIYCIYKDGFCSEEYTQTPQK